MHAQKPSLILLHGQHVSMKSAKAVAATQGDDRHPNLPIFSGLTGFSRFRISQIGCGIVGLLGDGPTHTTWTDSQDDIENPLWSLDFSRVLRRRTANNVQQDVAHFQCCGES